MLKRLLQALADRGVAAFVGPVIEPSHERLLAQLALKGWQVVWVFTRGQVALKTSLPAGVTPLFDEAPGLKHARAIGYCFDLVVLTGDWDAFARQDTARAMRLLSTLMAHSGRLVLPELDPVRRPEVLQAARQRALVDRTEDIESTGLVFELPDDGTGALPLIRNIIVNDSKSATYKLGLLRTVLMIADQVPGTVISQTDSRVVLPFGLVGLFWIRLYWPLVLGGRSLLQSPIHSPMEKTGLGFAKDDGFYALSRLSLSDLKVGTVLAEQEAKILVNAIAHACQHIAVNPGHFTTFPGSKAQVFGCTRARKPKVKGHWQLSTEALGQFGTLEMPTHLWQAMTRYACWIDPAIVNEWKRLMQGYDPKAPVMAMDAALTLGLTPRDTSEVRRRMQHLQAAQCPVRCVWTRKSLKADFHIDHCFPWSRWFNNDLWNLMPATVSANEKKKDRLPEARLMAGAEQAITDWWDMAYRYEPQFSERFFMEAEASLPTFDKGSRQLGLLFNAVMHQRTRLRVNLQLAEWKGL